MSTNEDALADVLSELGDFGRYQCFVVILLSVTVMFHAFPHNAYVFTAKNLDYRCEIQECNDNSNIFEPEWLSNAVPYKNGKPKNCEKYQFTEDNNNQTDSLCTNSTFDREIVEPCNHFVYSSKERTILADFNLHCDSNLWKLTMVGTINVIGQFVGMPISGILSDRYGRKTVLVIGTLVCSVVGIIRSFVTTYLLFCLLEFLDAAALAGTYVCCFLIGVELVGPKKRVFAGLLIWCFYPIGVVMTAAIAWMLQSWRYITLALYSPSFLIITYSWFIPESVRWLLTQGKYSEAREILVKAAKMNKKSLSKKALEKMSESASEETKEPLKRIFQSKILLMRFLNACVCWITCVFLFYGFTLNSIALAGNSYVDFMLTAIVEIPAYIVASYFIDKYGRRLCQSGMFFLTAVACLIYVFISDDYHSLQLVFYLLGKFGATAAFTVCYILSTEIFPTPLRNSLMGACSMFGRFGAMVSPQMPLLTSIWPPLPLLLFSGMSIIAGLLTLLFPETLNIKLPDTIEEAENIGKDLNEKAKKNVQE